MGRVLALFLAIIGLSCSVFSAPIPVIVSIPPFEKIVARIGGQYVHVTSLIPAGASDEIFEPDIRMLRVITSGRLYFSLMALPLEKGLTAKMGRLNSTMKIVSLVLPESAKDPHTWMSAKQVQRHVGMIVKGLSDYDPVHAAYYRKNGEQYLVYLKQLDHDLEVMLRGVKGKSFLIDHPTLGYFSRDYGLVQLSIDHHDGKPASGKELQALLNESRRIHPKAMVIQPDTPENRVRMFTSDAKIKKIWINPMVKDYDEMLRQIAWQFKANL